MNSIETATNLYNSQQYTEARDLSLDIIEKNPNDTGIVKIIHGSSECMIGNLYSGIKSLNDCISSNDLSIESLRRAFMHFNEYVKKTDYKLRVDIFDAFYKIFRNGISANPGSIEAYSWAGVSFLILMRYSESSDLLKKCTIIRPEDHTNWTRLARSLFGEGRTSSYLDSEKYYRIAIGINNNCPDSLAGLGINLFQQGRLEESIQYLEKSISIDSSQIGAQQTLNEALEQLKGNDSDHQMGPHSNQDSRFPKKYITRYPLRTSQVKNIRQAIRDHFAINFSNINKTRKDTSQTITFGSCFAGNINIALNERNIKSKYISVGEVVNSTYANLFFLDWVIDGTTDSNIKRTHEFSEIIPGDIIGYIKNADVIVFTLGVAWAFFNKDNEFIMPKTSEITMKNLASKFEFRATSVEENCENIIRIVKKIRSVNKECRIVFTLSPVPMSANFAMVSAFEADCISKSILRVSIENAINKMRSEDVREIHYWPSFEIVRWIAPYSMQPFGADDGNTLHVSGDLIGHITDEFVDIFYT